MKTTPSALSAPCRTCEPPQPSTSKGKSTFPVEAANPLLGTLKCVIRWIAVIGGIRCDCSHNLSSKGRSTTLAMILAAALGLVVLGAVPAAANPQATNTALKITSGGPQVASVASGSVVNLTATVSTGNGAVKRGQVNFCDGAAQKLT